MVKANRTESYRIAGIYEPIEYTVEYRICDICGAEDIVEVGKHLSSFVNGAFSFVIIALSLISVIGGIITSSLRLCGGLALFAIIVLVSLLSLTKFVERNNHFRCNKCGNEHVT